LFTETQVYELGQCIAVIPYPVSAGIPQNRLPLPLLPRDFQ